MGTGASMLQEIKSVYLTTAPKWCGYAPGDRLDARLEDAQRPPVFAVSSLDKILWIL